MTDLHTAVAVSMLPAARSRVAAVLRDLREQEAHPTLVQVLEALDTDPDEHPAIAVRARASAAAALARAAASGFDALGWFDARYPALLNCIADPPPVLWIRGDATVLSRPTVAVVGSRAATPYALEVAARIAAELAERSIVVASGLARGVDSAAHRGCLEEGGTTVAVLGSGLDRVYPPEHRSLADVIATSGAVISECCPGAAALPQNFPLRNRIISGISLGVVVVEASEKSGSLITARCATEQGRDVLAVPGSVLSGRNRGSHGLLKDGARVVESAEDILEELGWPAAREASARRLPAMDCDPVLARMDVGEQYGLEDLVAATGMLPSKILARLTDLELSGHVSASEGGRFRRVVV